MEELWQALFTSGTKDIELDMLIVWSMLELGARRGGPITMKIGDLQIHSRTVRLGEKNDKIDNQPASPALIMTLLDHLRPAVRRPSTIAPAGRKIGDREIRSVHVTRNGDSFVCTK
jgi:hypothetical protein